MNVKKKIVGIAAVMGMVAYGDGNYADMVVYGTIRTAEEGNPVAEAIAVKDGKFIYVGDEAGAAAFVKDGVTQIVDHRGKGMVMPSCTDGHAHYVMPLTLANMKDGVLLGHKANRIAKLVTEPGSLRQSVKGSHQANDRNSEERNQNLARSLQVADFQYVNGKNRLLCRSTGIQRRIWCG